MRKFEKSHTYLFVFFYVVLISAQDVPKLTRTLTTVSTDYLFSPCYIQQLDRTFYYDYEYLGPSRHLVVTPLTERAFLSMGHAVKTFYCGTMTGPSGTGKSETIKEHARVSYHLFCFQCK